MSRKKLDDFAVPQDLDLLAAFDLVDELARHR
jgi:hypothetical protein